MNQAILDTKKVLVEEIAGKLKDSASTVVVEYRGLSVAEVTELRRELRNEGVEFKVYKNSMVSRAADTAELADLKDSLTGPNAIAFSDDAIAPSRVLVKFAKKHQALVVKAGVVEGNVVDLSTIEKLSDLPNREGMISMILGMFQSPVRKFAYLLSAVRDQKEENA